ncbi:hypothetical protein [Niabella hirudinis]|uniref:hypothetical protein n=1 Tax=Niabella hirudinis TaxID=1285929 RepID=UPI003EBF2B27
MRKLLQPSGSITEIIQGIGLAAIALLLVGIAVFIIKRRSREQFRPESDERIKAKYPGSKNK